MQVPERVYQGALLGVTSIVVLHGSAEYATIVLKGKPLLGTVRGRATMNSDGSVNMDKTLDNAIAALRVGAARPRARRRRRARGRAQAAVSGREDGSVVCAKLNV